MPYKVSEKKLFLSVFLFILALVCAYFAIFDGATHRAGSSLFLLVVGFIAGRTGILIFKYGRKNVNHS
ncbi:MAG: hypothetical protein ACM3VS_13060 [Candidatus Dadabacteria bacterium]